MYPLRYSIPIPIPIPPYELFKGIITHYSFTLLPMNPASLKNPGRLSPGFEVWVRVAPPVHTKKTSRELAFPLLSLLRPRRPPHACSRCPRRLGSLEAEFCVVCRGPHPHRAGPPTVRLPPTSATDPAAPRHAHLPPVHVRVRTTGLWPGPALHHRVLEPLRRRAQPCRACTQFMWALPLEGKVQSPPSTVRMRDWQVGDRARYRSTYSIL